MIKTFLSLLSPLLVSLLLAQKSASPIAKQRPAEYEYLSAPDSAGKRTLLKMPSIDKNMRSQHAELPYPIIFIHGLNSSAATWNTSTDFMDMQYGMIYGGRLDYCLNYDGDYTNANLNFAPTAVADLAFFTSTLTVGDYYYVNFDVGSNESFSPSSSNPYNVESNQSAVFKQGLAIKWAIYQVLQITGKDKVILMGHSMGGLAARQYLQNSTLWQSDGEHHVAKLVTTGTPHGGSNSTAFGLSSVDENSEAVRDLRTSYTYSGDYGVYLFGGLESDAVMYDRLLYDFYNVDVNCNGVVGENVAGLDQKNIYVNLDYSCIIGECTTCPLGEELPGDGVVNDGSANLKNYYSGLNVNLFYYYGSDNIDIHTALPSQIIQNMQGLDEPDDYDLAYHVGFDTSYLGFTTFQDPDNPNYPTDFDEYKFSLSAKSNVSVEVGNITLSDLWIQIVNSSFQVVGNAFHSNGSSSISFTDTLYAGDYYLEIYGTVPASNYVIPYNFALTKTTITAGINEVSEKLCDVLIYPNPASNKLIINTSNFQPVIMSIYDTNDKKVTEEKYMRQVDISLLPAGIYFMELKGADAIVRKRFVKL